MRDAEFQELGGLFSILAGIGGFLYAVAFIIVARSSPEAGRLLSAIFLMLGGLLSTGALTALYGRLGGANQHAALWALLLGVAGELGAGIHGAYDLALVLHPLELGAAADAPSPIDPRGLLTFGVTGVSLLIFSRLIGGSRAFPRGLSSFGYVEGALLLLLYLGRLIVLNPASPIIVIPGILAGFITGPAWYVWLGLVLRRA